MIRTDEKRLKMLTENTHCVRGFWGERLYLARLLNRGTIYFFTHVKCAEC